MRLGLLLQKEPSSEVFGRICEHLERAYYSDQLNDVLPKVLEVVESWPSSVREAPPYWINKLVWCVPDDQEFGFSSVMLSPVCVLSLSEVTIKPETHKPLPSTETVLGLIREGLQTFYESTPEQPQLEKIIASFSEKYWERREKLPGGSWGTKYYDAYRAQLEPWMQAEDVRALLSADLCRNVRSLDLSGNTNLTDVPGLESLEKLEELDLSFSEITSIPPALGSLENVKTLRLSYCDSITDFSALGDMPQLEELDLRLSNMGPIPPEFAGLTKLRVLNLERGSVEDIKNLCACKSLEVLDLSGNYLPFQDAKTSFRSFKKLRQLKLENCNPPPHASHPMGPFNSIGRLPQLEDLSLQMCGLKKIPKNLHTLTSLRRLDLSHNKVEDLTGLKDLPLLEVLDLSLNPVKTIPAEFKTLESLRKLDLTEHRLSKLDGLRGLEKLEELDLTLWVESRGQTRGSLKKLPDWFGELRALRSLSLVNNGRLVNIEALVGLEKLKKIDLRGCTACKIPSAWEGRTDLRITRGNTVI